MSAPPESAANVVRRVRRIDPGQSLRMRARRLAPVAVGCKQQACPHNVITLRAELRCRVERPLDRELRLAIRVSGMLDAAVFERRSAADGYVRPARTARE